MSELNGYDNEKNFVNYLEGKKICELNPLFLNLFAYLFPNASGDAIINCWANYLNQKADILIKVEGKVKDSYNKNQTSQVIQNLIKLI